MSKQYIKFGEKVLLDGRTGTVAKQIACDEAYTRVKFPEGTEEVNFEDMTWCSERKAWV